MEASQRGVQDTILIMKLSTSLKMSHDDCDEDGEEDKDIREIIEEQ